MDGATGVLNARSVGGGLNKAPGRQEVAGGIPFIDLVSERRQSSRDRIFSASSRKRTKTGWRRGVRGCWSCGLGAKTFL